MANKTVQEKATVFFDAFVEAFAAFDGARIAQRYAAPYVALNTEGVVESLPTHAEIARYFQTVVDAYYSEGCRACRYKDLAVQALGSQSALASVTWELLREDGSLLKTWRESYAFAPNAQGWRIFASIDHTG